MPAAHHKKIEVTHMIQIAVTEVNEFLRRTKNIKTNNVMPLLGYIKMVCRGDTVTLYKTNLGVHCKHEVAGVFQKEHTILLDENILNTVCSNAKGDTLTISYTVEPGESKVDSDIVTVDLQVGTAKVTFQTEDARLFPEFPEELITTEKTKLDAEFLQAMAIAKHYALPGEKGNPSLWYIHIINQRDSCLVFASTGHMLYRKTFAQAIPSMIISQEACTLITSFSEVHHYTASNYDFFDTGKTTYGFVQPETSHPDTSRFTRFVNEGGYIMDRQKLIDFCQMAASLTPSPTATSLIKDAGTNKVQMAFTELDWKVASTVELDCVKEEEINPFSFNAKLMLHALKAISYDKLTLTHPSPGIMAIWSEDKDYMGLLLGYIDQNKSN
jgi:DNA polymerase III sliding clamp (beta) subunit (PCNA family)